MTMVMITMMMMILNIVITGFRYSVRMVCTLTISAVALIGVKSQLACDRLVGLLLSVRLTLILVLQKCCAYIMCVVNIVNEAYRSSVIVFYRYFSLDKLA